MPPDIREAVARYADVLRYGATSAERESPAATSAT
jgi:hypothetical protein